jgi:hypothetical protein
MRTRLWLDMTDDAEFDSNLLRLSEVLRVDPEGEG